MSDSKIADDMYTNAPVQGKRGMYIIDRFGRVRQLDRRKDDGEDIWPGWWLTDGSGLADWCLAGPGWRLLDAEALALLFPEETT